MINIQGRIYIDITIDGNKLPFSPNLVDRITMTEGGAALSPAIEIMFNDYGGTLNRELALTDGNEILVTVGKTPDDIKTISRQYRVFGMRNIATAYGPRMQVIGIYDAPGYLTGTAREAYRGNTGSVLKQVAEKCKLCYDGPEDFNGKTLDDSQVWRNVCKSRAVFVQEITRHAYLDPNSTMTAMLSSLGKLLYRNLSDVIETSTDKIKRVFVHNIDQQFIKENDLTAYEVTEARSRSTAGLMNTWQNYGSTRVEHNLSGAPEIHDKVDVQTGSEYLPINATVKKTVERTRIEYTPLDSGNTHKNYQKAVYQNLKLMGLFSEYVSLLTRDVTDVQLLDPVLYRQANADPAEPLGISDVYIVVAKTIFVKGGANYAERLELVRRSLPNKGATELSCAPTPAQSAASAMPDSIIDPTSTVTRDSLPNAMELGSMGTPTQQSFDKIKSTMPDIRRGVGYTLPTLKGAQDTLSQARSGVQMGVAPAQNLIGNIRGSIASLTHFAAMGAGLVNDITRAAASLTDMRVLMDIKNLPMALRSAMMFQPAGIMNSYTALLGTSRQMNQMNAVLTPIAAGLARQGPAIQQVQGGPEAVKEFTTLQQQISQQCDACQKQTNIIWNESLSVLSGQPTPDVSTMKPSSADRMTQVQTNLYRAPASGSTPIVSLGTSTDDVVKQMTSKTGDRQLPWIPPTSNWSYDSNLKAAEAEYRTNPEYDLNATSGTGEIPFNQSITYAIQARKALEVEGDLAELREREMYGGQGCSC